MKNKKAISKDDIIRLHELPRGAKIVTDGISDGSKFIIFDHPDGMFSYCETEKGGIIHLSVMTPLVKVKDHYEIVDRSLLIE